MEYDFKTFQFGRGKHQTREDGMCLMEAVAYIAGEEHTDHPKCVQSNVAAYCRHMNDICNDKQRKHLYKYVWLALDTANITKEQQDKINSIIMDCCIASGDRNYDINQGMIQICREDNIEDYFDVLNKYSCDISKAFKINILRKTIDRMLDVLLIKEVVPQVEVVNAQ